MRFVLASASPRRQELLCQIGIAAMVEKSDFVECVDADYREVVRVNAQGKLCDVVKRISPTDDTVVIAADTIVVMEDKIFGKPADAKDAREMLRMLSGKKHCVRTGIAIYYKGEMRYNYNDTGVYMNSISEDEVEKYVDSGEPMDKAGAYAIQGLAAVFIKKIDGCYSNVVGLSLPLLYEMFQELGIKIR